MGGGRKPVRSVGGPTMVLKGRRGRCKSNREDSKGQGLCRTLVHTHLGANLLMAIESNLL